MTLLYSLTNAPEVVLSTLQAGHDQIAHDQEFAMLDAALSELSPRDQRIVLSRFWEQRSLRDIGAEHGMSQEGIRRRLHRAFIQLGGLLASGRAQSTTLKKNTA